VRVIKIIGINLITFALLLVISNWACGVYLRNRDQVNTRHALPNYKNDPVHAEKVFGDYGRIKHQYEPFVGWKCLPYRGETLRIGANGERMHRAPADSTITKPVVHFFGGSTMWGEGSDDQHTIPALFNQINPEFTVTNHAQLAYNTRQELDALITMYSRGERADVVIFYDGVNDAAFLCPKEISELPAHRLVPMYRENLYAGRTRMVKTLVYRTFIENIAKVANKFKPKRPESSPYDCLGEAGKAEEIAEMVIRNWEMAEQLVTKRGGRFFAVLQPAAYVGKPRTDHLKLDPDLGRNFAEVYKRLAMKVKQRNHPWIHDLSNKFDGDEYIYIDFCHVSPNGNRIIAEEISKVVKQQDDISNVVSVVRE
jgi:hypothetical protein